jgi:6-phosphogluconolactonase
MANPTIVKVADPAALADEAAKRFIELGNKAIAAKGTFSVALSGGSTPKAMHNLLASKYKDQIDWNKVEIYFGDERCVPPEHSDSNYKMARETLLSKVPIPEQNVYRMRGEIQPEDAAKEYGMMLKEKFGDKGLDLVFLGMGDDGHTLSIFPGTIATKEKEHRVIGYFAENSSTGKSWRVTMTAPFVNRAQNVLFLVGGASKANRLKEVLKGPREPERLPSQLIQPSPGNLTFLVDNAAGSAI